MPKFGHRRIYVKQLHPSGLTTSQIFEAFLSLCVIYENGERKHVRWQDVRSNFKQLPKATSKISEALWKEEQQKIFDGLAAWCSRQRISLRTRGPGFESRQSISFLGNHNNAVVITIDLICFVCVLEKRNKGIGQKLIWSRVTSGLIEMKSP
jgi:hypothetical protein